MSALRFEIDHQSISCGARVGRVHTPHGSFDTPAFMPVGTKATVKGLLPETVEQTGSQILLNNTYHLLLRPGSDLIQRMGGVHRFMGWDRPILTDSGGFQVFSLSDMSTIDDDGVTFKSHLDGAMIRLTPERSIEVQNQLGADIIMAFDDCPPASVEQLAATGGGVKDLAVATSMYRQRNHEAAERSWQWVRRCCEAHRQTDQQALFGIVQGGTDLALRSQCAAELSSLDLPGYAIGGVAVGESPALMQQVVEHTAPLLPAARPRYLMGVGYERDLLMAVRAGMDMFDCVLPTRNGRNANAFTRTGPKRLRNACFKDDPGPIDPGCDCLTCRRFSRSYLRHLFLADEMLGPILVSIHNIRHFQRFMSALRHAIVTDDWPLLQADWPVAFVPPASSD